MVSGRNLFKLWLNQHSAHSCKSHTVSDFDSNVFTGNGDHLLCNVELLLFEQKTERIVLLEQILTMIEYVWF